MPIAALSENAVRAIGSSQVLTDPCSVVKELIDNALDARATSIYVEVSLNTLDVVQVKDNGYGIGPEDRAMLCRRYCTSKIRNLEDLRDIGGRLLGFRGEALASAAELSGSLVVTTRIEGEPVAVSLKIDRNGEIKSQEKVSHPVGSTVKVVDFLKYLPVRRQTALKSAQKTLAKIKHTLQAYAIARPSIRLSLKVLKAKNDKGNYVYAPKAGASVPDAAMKVVDKRISGQCQWISWCSSEMGTPTLDTAIESEVVQDKEGVDSAYTIEAFLPRPDAEASVIGTAGYFISIDSRPVMCTRGFLKQLITVYKSYVRSACSTSTEKIANPFLCMNIVCPRGSYDANVEPAKDDVLFVDQGRLLLILDAFFKSVYGELEITDNRKVQKTEYRHAPKDPKGFGLLLARKPQRNASSVSASSPSTDRPTTELAGNAHHKSNAEGKLQVNAESTVEQAEARTEIHQLLTQSIGPSKVKRVGRKFRNSQSPNHSPSDYNAAEGKDSLKGNSTWHFSMYGGDEEHVEELDDTSTRITEDEIVDGNGLENVNVSNPWTIAKMNSFVRPGRRIEPDPTIGEIVENGQFMTPARERIGHRTSTIVPSNGTVHRTRGNDANLQTPPHILRSPSPSPRGQSSSGAWHFPSKAWAKAQADLRTAKTKDQPAEPNDAGSLDTWIRSSPDQEQSLESIDGSHFTRGLVGGNRNDVLAANQRIHGISNDFVSARSLQQGTQLSDIPEAPPKRTPRLGIRKQAGPSNQQGAINKPLVSPVNDPTKVWFEMEQQRRPRPHPHSQSQGVRNTMATTAPIRFESETEDINAETSLVNLTPPHSHPTQMELEDLMEYEHRKSAATQAYKSSLYNQAKLGLATPTTERVNRGRLSSGTSPHKNRYEAAKAALTPSRDNADKSPPVLADGDPRAYLIRVQKREQEAGQRDSIALVGAPHKLRRARTIMLPLETIAADRQLHNLVLNILTDVASVKKREMEAIDTDEYVRSGETPCGLLDNIPNEEARAWEQKISRSLKNTYYGAQNGDRTEEMPFGFSPALRRHRAAHT